MDEPPGRQERATGGGWSVDDGAGGTSPRGGRAAAAMRSCTVRVPRGRGRRARRVICRRRGAGAGAMPAIGCMPCDGRSLRTSGIVSSRDRCGRENPQCCRRNRAHGTRPWRHPPSPGASFSSVASVSGGSLRSSRKTRPVGERDRVVPSRAATRSGADGGGVVREGAVPEADSVACRRRTTRQRPRQPLRRG